MSTAALTPQLRYTRETIDGFYEAGHWRHATLWDDLEAAVERSPDGLCVTDTRTDLSFAQVKSRAAAFAGALDSLGIRRGDRVCVQLPNVADFVPIVCGISRLGATVVPMMPIYRRAEVQSILERTGATAFIGIDEFRSFDYIPMLEEIVPACPSLKVVAILGEPAAGMLRLDDFWAHAPFEGPRPDPDDLFCVNFTSGTESKAKGCMHTYNTFSFIPRSVGAELRLSEDDVCFMPSPVTHMTGLAMGVGAPIIFKHAAVLQDIWEPTLALEHIKKYGCTYTVGASPFVKTLLEVFDPNRHRAPRFRAFGCGGAPIPPDLARAAVEQMGITLIPIYGQGEYGLGTAGSLDDDIDTIASRDGRAIGAIEVKIVEPEQQAEAAPGTVGEILVRSPGLMLGYYDDPERTAATIDPDGWMHTGDLGRMDERGYIRVTGRLKDIIIRGGMNISALEVEEIVGQHPNVKEVAAVGMADERLGEKVCIFVVPAGEGPTLTEIVEFMRGQGVATQKLPERLELIDEIPRNFNGKMLKFKLRESLAPSLRNEGEPA